MPTVQFEIDQADKKYLRTRAGKPPTGMTAWLIRHKVVRSEKQANLLLLALVVVGIIITLVNVRNLVSDPANTVPPNYIDPALL